MLKSAGSFVLSDSKPLSTYALKHYLAHFDFTNLRLDDAFRYVLAAFFNGERVDRKYSAERYVANSTSKLRLKKSIGSWRRSAKDTSHAILPIYSADPVSSPATT